MTRKRNTTILGGSFSEATRDAVWEKAEVIPGQTSRKDACGATIKKGDYGTTGTYGWEIDHIKPVAEGGTDALSNLQPLLWENNRHKSDDYPNWSCKKKT